MKLIMFRLFLQLLIALMLPVGVWCIQHGSSVAFEFGIIFFVAFTILSYGIWKIE